jgi:hypothetical protein
MSRIPSTDRAAILALALNVKSRHRPLEETESLRQIRQAVRGFGIGRELVAIYLTIPALQNVMTVPGGIPHAPGIPLNFAQVFPRIQRDCPS